MRSRGSAVSGVALACLSALAGLALASTGCKDLDPPPPAPFNIYIKVESDPGRPIPGVVVTRNSTTLATTGPDGRAMLTLRGAEGENTDVNVKCPDTFQSPTKPIAIKLTRFADPKKVPEYAVSCPPMVRHVVVAVKTENGPNLPVMYLNRMVTRTDASGTAHFLLEVAPGAQFVVSLDTSENPRLKPQAPSKPFAVGQSDEIVLWEQKFEEEKVRHYVPVPRRAIPRALN